MFLHHKLFHTILFASMVLGLTKAHSNGVNPSTWTGANSSDMTDGSNWTHDVPFLSTAIFNGNGDNSPMSNLNEGLSFAQIAFTAATEVSIITTLQVNSSLGVSSSPGVLANFDIYEHQPLFYSPAEMTIASGTAGSGGGTINYNLQGFGQLYAFSGAALDTIVNVTMTEGNNYFEISGLGNNSFDNVNSDSENDEISLLLNATLTISNSESNAILGVILGEGSLTKTGTGILSLDNYNTYTGDTEIEEGTLILNGSILGNLLLSSQGTLKGSGKIYGSLTSSGILSPGNSIGTLTVGNFFPTSSNVFVCEINSMGLSDQIDAIGSAELTGTLQVIPLDLSFSYPKTYDIVHADTGITGLFSTVTTTVPALMSLTYDPNDVFLTYIPLSIINPQGNAKAAANCFLTLSGSDANTVSSELLTLTVPEIRKSFNQMQPSQFSGLTWTQLQNALLIRSGYLQHLDEFSNAKDSSRVWIDGIGQWQHQGSKNDQFGYHDWTSGVSLGTDTSYKNFQFGAAGSYTYSDLHWTQSAGSGKINSYYGGFYGSWSDEVKYINFTTLGSYSHYSTSRHLHFATLDRHAKSSHHSWEALAGIETGVYAKVNHFKMGPFVRVDYVYLSQNAYNESGAKSLNLHVDSRQDQLIQSQAGAVFMARYGSESSSGTFTPRLELSYINQSPLAKSHYHTKFIDSGCQFDVSGQNFLRNLGAIGLGLTYLSQNEKIGVSFQYDGQFGSRYWNQSGNLMLDLKY